MDACVTYLSTGAVARKSLTEQEADTLICEDTLLHGETLLIITTRDTEDVTLEFVPDMLSIYLLRYASVIESTTV